MPAASQPFLPYTALHQPFFHLGPSVAHASSVVTPALCAAAAALLGCCALHVCWRHLHRCRMARRHWHFRRVVSGVCGMQHTKIRRPRIPDTSGRGTHMGPHALALARPKHIVTDLKKRKRNREALCLIQLGVHSRAWQHMAAGWNKRSADSFG